MSLRRRLTIALMLAVGLSAGALAAGSYFVVRHNLLSDSVDSSARQARTNLKIAPAYLKESPHALLKAYERAGGGFETVGIGPAGLSRRASRRARARFPPRSGRSSVTETSATSARESPGRAT